MTKQNVRELKNECKIKVDIFRRENQMLAVNEKKLASSVTFHWDGTGGMRSDLSDGTDGYTGAGIGILMKDKCFEKMSDCKYVSS